MERVIRSIIHIPFDTFSDVPISNYINDGHGVAKLIIDFYLTSGRLDNDLNDPILLKIWTVHVRIENLVCLLFFPLRAKSRILMDPFLIVQ
jgi:hypothetical protein